MQSSIVKYCIAAIAILFLFSTAEISKEESRQFSNAESHVFLGTENLSLDGGGLSCVSPLSPLLFLPFNVGLHNTLWCVEAEGLSDHPPTRHAVPLYLDISSLRI